MNIADNHTGKPVSTYPLFKGEGVTTIAIRIYAGEELAEHISKIKALLICINGNAQFADENGHVFDLKNGDFVNIEPMIKHKVLAIETSNLILIK